MGRRRPRTRHLRLIASVVVAALMVAGCSNSTSNRRAAVGKVAPTFVAPGLLGDDEIRLTDYRGKPVLLNFFASWCEPCRDELPLLQRTHDRDDAAVVAVLFEDSPSSARTFLRELDVSLPAVEDDGAIADAYGVDFKPGLPLTFVISSDGVLAARHIGQLRESDVRELLQKARDRG